MITAAEQAATYLKLATLLVETPSVYTVGSDCACFFTESIEDFRALETKLAALGTVKQEQDDTHHGVSFEIGHVNLSVFIPVRFWRAARPVLVPDSPEVTGGLPPWPFEAPARKPWLLETRTADPELGAAYELFDTEDEASDRASEEVSRHYKATGHAVGMNEDRKTGAKCECGKEWMVRLATEADYANLEELHGHDQPTQL